MQFPLSHSTFPPTMYITFFVRLQSIPLYDGTTNYLSSLLLINIFIDIPDFLIFKQCYCEHPQTYHCKVIQYLCDKFRGVKLLSQREFSIFLLDIAKFPFTEIGSIHTLTQPTFTTHLSTKYIIKFLLLPM